ncbi:MAG: chrA, partial [Acidobacteria bacterium]|nr:chrA [Acidobacteriota bacterium]
SAMVRRRDLAATLFRVGLTAYGGPAIVAQIRQAIVFEKRWLSDEEFQESVAFAQMLPGPVAIQTAAHVGWRLHGAHGAFLALAAYSLPAFALILALSAAYFHYGTLPAVAAVFRALATVIVAIVVESILSMAQPALKDLRGVAIAALAAWGFFAGTNALLVLLGAALAGVALRLGRGNSTGDTAPVAPHGRPSVVTAAAVLAAAALLAAAVFGSGRLNRELPALGATMTRINLLSFGGGYTAVALMYGETVGRPARGWLTPKEFVDGLALSQVTPGPVIVTGTRLPAAAVVAPARAAGAALRGDPPPRAGAQRGARVARRVHRDAAVRPRPGREKRVRRGLGAAREPRGDRRAAAARADGLAAARRRRGGSVLPALSAAVGPGLNRATGSSPPSRPARRGSRVPASPWRWPGGSPRCAPTGRARRRPRGWCGRARSCGRPRARGG